MDQKTIIEGLQKALVNGSGNLDDLEKLLKRAQADVVQAKEDAKVAEAKRGQEIAELANRILEGKTTDADAALVLNTWLRAKGLNGAPFTAEDLKKIFVDGTFEAIAKPKYTNTQVQKALKDLVNNISSFVEHLNTTSDDVKKAPEKKKTEQDPDDVISRFLRDFGLE